MIEAVEFLREIVTKDDLWAAVSLVATLCAVGAVAYVMHYAVRMEEESVQRRLGAKGLKVRSETWQHWDFERIICVITKLEGGTTKLSGNQFLL